MHVPLRFLSPSGPRQWSAGVLLFTMVSGVLPFQYAKPGDWWFDRVRNNQMHLFWQAHFRTCAFPPLVVGAARAWGAKHSRPSSPVRTFLTTCTRLLRICCRCRCCCCFVVTVVV
jgi:hypothetical protein